MTKEEYANSIKELAPDWEYPKTFETFEEAIDFYYDFDMLNIFVQDIKTQKVIKLSNTMYVNEFTLKEIKEIKEYRDVTLLMYKKFEEQKKIEDIAKDFE